MEASPLNPMDFMVRFTSWEMFCRLMHEDAIDPYINADWPFDPEGTARLITSIDQDSTSIRAGLLRGRWTNIDVLRHLYTIWSKEEYRLLPSMVGVAISTSLGQANSRVESKDGSFTAIFSQNDQNPGSPTPNEQIIRSQQKSYAALHTDQKELVDGFVDQVRRGGNLPLIDGLDPDVRRAYLGRFEGEPDALAAAMASLSEVASKDPSAYYKHFRGMVTERSYQAALDSKHSACVLALVREGVDGYQSGGELHPNPMRNAWAAFGDRVANIRNCKVNDFHHVFASDFAAVYDLFTEFGQSLTEGQVAMFCELYDDSGPSTTLQELFDTARAL